MTTAWILVHTKVATAQPARETKGN